VALNAYVVYTVLYCTCIEMSHFSGQHLYLAMCVSISPGGSQYQAMHATTESDHHCMRHACVWQLTGQWMTTVITIVTCTQLSADTADTCYEDTCCDVYGPSCTVIAASRLYRSAEYYATSSLVALFTVCVRQCSSTFACQHSARVV